MNREKRSNVIEESGSATEMANRNNLSLFHAGAGLIDTLTPFENGLSASDCSKQYSLCGLATESTMISNSGGANPVEAEDLFTSSNEVVVGKLVPNSELIVDEPTNGGLRGLRCCSCHVTFHDRTAQVEHYKLDWHRYNIKRALVDLEPVTWLDFEESVLRRQSEGAELSSISGSDDEDADDEDADDENDDNRAMKKAGFLSIIGDSLASPPSSSAPPPHHHHPKVFFRLPDGKVGSLYRALLFPKAERGAETTKREDGCIDKLKDLVKNAGELKTAVILTGGGHFAAAIFRGDQVMEHKTFHRYVVRQKQGGTQSGKDSCGHAPKSAGASLRRYNEAALAKDIKVLLGETWVSMIAACDLVFIRAPSSNRHIFFTGKPPLFVKSDVRIRLIPFLTRRPTFNEVQRVFKVLTAFEIYDVDGDSQVLIGKSGFPKSPPKRSASRTTKSIESKFEGFPTTTTTTSETSAELPVSASNELTTTTSVSTREFDDRFPSRSGKRERRVAKENRRLKNLRGQEAPDIERSSSSEDEDDVDNHDDDDVEASLSVLTHRLESLDTSGLKLFDCDFGGGGGGGGGGRGSRGERRTRRKKPTDGPSTEAAVERVDEDVDESLIARVFSTFKNDLLTFCRTTDEEGFHRTLNKCREEFEKRIRERTETDECRGSMSEVKETSLKTGMNTVVDGDVRERIDDVNEPIDAVRERFDDANEPIDAVRERFVDADDRLSNLVSRLLNSSVRLGSTTQFTSLLHVASQTGSGGGVCGRDDQIPFVRRLLALGCDPAKKDSEGKTVYLAAEKQIRLALRHFRSEFPEKFDYEAAGIPAARSEREVAEKAERQAERKKKLRQAKKERDKEKKAERMEEEKQREKEKEAEEEKRRFLALSDREKRALAAERRFAAQQNASMKTTMTTTTTTARCCLCAFDMTGLVPFEYSELKFCSVKCLQEHRTKNTTT